MYQISIKTILAKKVMLSEKIIVWPISGGHLVPTKIGVHDKDGAYINHTFYTTRYVEGNYHQERIEMMDESIEVMKKYIKNGKNLPNFIIPWRKCYLMSILARFVYRD